MWKQRFFRIALCSWLLFGHGIPKLSAWWFGVALWGPHQFFEPTNSFSALAAIIECICPLMILIGFQIRWNAIVVSSLLILSAFALPFPWLHIRLPIENAILPFAILPSKEMAMTYGLAYVSFLFFARDEPFWKRFDKN